jgi:hypothetical protein
LGFGEAIVPCGPQTHILGSVLAVTPSTTPLFIRDSLGLEILPSTSMFHLVRVTAVGDQKDEGEMSETGRVHKGACEARPNRRIS